jgi:hypothetical protein
MQMPPQMPVNRPIGPGQQLTIPFNGAPPEQMDLFPQQPQDPRLQMRMPPQQMPLPFPEVQPPPGMQPKLPLPRPDALQQELEFTLERQIGNNARIIADAAGKTRSGVVPKSRFARASLLKKLRLNIRPEEFERTFDEANRILEGRVRP